MKKEDNRTAEQTRNKIAIENGFPDWQALTTVLKEYHNAMCSAVPVQEQSKQEVKNSFCSYGHAITCQNCIDLDKHFNLKTTQIQETEHRITKEDALYYAVQKAMDYLNGNDNKTLDEVYAILVDARDNEEYKSLSETSQENGEKIKQLVEGAEACLKEIKRSPTRNESEAVIESMSKLVLEIFPPTDKTA